MSLMHSIIEAEPFADSFAHPIDQRPYRMVVFSCFNGHDKPVYWVAGTTAAVLSAKNALSRAIKEHGGTCFYCNEADNLTIEHAVAKSRGGSETLSNLLVACRTCNLAKGNKAIEEHDPKAARRWLTAVMAQNRRRLDRINANHPIA